MYNIILHMISNETPRDIFFEKYYISKCLPPLIFENIIYIALGCLSCFLPTILKHAYNFRPWYQSTLGLNQIEIWRLLRCQKMSEWVVSLS